MSWWARESEAAGSFDRAASAKPVSGASVFAATRANLGARFIHRALLFFGRNAPACVVRSSLRIEELVHSLVRLAAAWMYGSLPHRFGTARSGAGWEWWWREAEFAAEWRTARAVPEDCLRLSPEQELSAI